MELVIKATKLDATYDRNPTGHPDATRFDTAFYDEVLQRGLEIMDSTAIAFWKSHAMLPLLSKTWWIALR
jgi:uridylate kinase